MFAWIHVALPEVPMLHIQQNYYKLEAFELLLPRG